MSQKSEIVRRGSSPYNASFTREQFLFYEMRITAQLLCEGLSEDEAADRIVRENLFQYPTEKSIRRMALACLRRLKAMEDESLVQALAAQPFRTAKQICLYAMMKQYRVIWDFMVTVVGEKYRSRDESFGKMEINAFFMRLQEQDDGAAAWSDSTITRLKQVLAKILIDNEYLDNHKSNRLNPVWLNSVLENAIRANHDEVALPAFNCFS